jgi:hypothetical protein
MNGTIQKPYTEEGWQVLNAVAIFFRPTSTLMHRLEQVRPIPPPPL